MSLVVKRGAHDVATDAAEAVDADLMGITSSDGVSEIEAGQKRVTAAGEQKMLWVARTKVNARIIRPAIMAAMKDRSPGSALRSLFDSEHGASDRLLPRWIFLRAHGLIYLLRVFFTGPSNSRIDWAARNSSRRRISASVGRAVRPFGVLVCADAALDFEQFAHADGNLLGGYDRLVAAGLEFWPRGMLAVCFVCFLSFVSAAQDFPLISLMECCWRRDSLRCFSRRRDGDPDGAKRIRPSRASLFLLVWEGFRIYFESGVAKIIGGDPQWRNFTALDEYYQNGPLPTWIGWYMQHLPHWFHAATAFVTLALELVLAWMMFLPRRVRILCFFIVTPWQIGIILSRELHLSELSRTRFWGFCYSMTAFYCPTCRDSGRAAPRHQKRRNRLGSQEWKKIGARN